MANETLLFIEHTTAHAGHTQPYRLVGTLSESGSGNYTPATSSRHRFTGQSTRRLSATDSVKNERHERHFNIKMSPATPTPHIMRTGKTSGQAPLPTGSRIATHST